MVTEVCLQQQQQERSRRRRGADTCVSNPHAAAFAPSLCCLPTCLLACVTHRTSRSWV
jgi:hypothetical protein